MKLKFTKMHGAGNDFVVIDAIRQNIDITPEIARFLAHRQLGVGADQILVVESPRMENVDFRYRIFNADGSEVQQCGNGARTFVKFVTEQGLTEKHDIRVETKSGIITLRLEDDGNVTVNMGAPELGPAKVPFDTTGLRGAPEQHGTLWPLYLEHRENHGKTVQIAVVSMGNPHAVQIVDDIAAAPVAIDGPLIEQHRRFPERVNAGFMQIDDRHAIHLRVYERGAGETLACGTGACAAVVSGILCGWLDSPVHVTAPGGEMTIAWAGIGQPVMMTGPAVSVFEGVIDVPQ